MAAYDAGAIEARLAVDTAEASADLDRFEARVKKLEDTPHIVRVAAVFDNASIMRARTAFSTLDTMISRDALQRLQTSPYGSVLGTLDALFSPHPLAGGPSSQQAASRGLLGQMLSQQATTGIPGAQPGGKGATLGETILGSAAAGAGAPVQQRPAVVETGASSGAAASDLEEAAAAQKGAAADDAAAASDLRESAAALRDSALGLSSAGATLAGLQKLNGASGTAPVAGVASGGGTGNSGAPSAAAAAAGSSLPQLDAAIRKAYADYALLNSEMNDMREPAILAALPGLQKFDVVLSQIGDDLKGLDQPGAATAQAVAGMQAQLKGAAAALDQFEQDMPSALAGLAALQARVTGAGTSAGTTADRYGDATKQMSGLGTEAGQSGNQAQSAAAKLLALAAAADNAKEAAQFASAAQKAFAGTETDVGDVAKTAAAALGAMASATTQAGDASRYAYASQVAAGIAAKALASAQQQAGSAAQYAGAKTALFTDAISAGTALWHSAGSGAGFLTSHLELFGGALTSVGAPKFLSTVSGLHLLSEAVIETAGTFIPAAIAFTAFGIAAVPTVDQLYKQLSNAATVSKAFGGTIQPLTGGFGKMAAAVQPEVYTLFGEGLVYASKSTGTFAGLATASGKVLDDLGARFVYATTQGGGFSTFVDKASSDLSVWGNNLGNLGGIFGGLLKVLPGYAEIIGNVFGAVSHDIELVVNSGLGQDVLKFFLIFHGGILYIGLLGTAFAKLASGALSAVAPMLLRAGDALAGFGGVAGKAGSGLQGLAVEAKAASQLPWGWISIAAAGVGFLVYELITAKSAAQQFAAAIQSTITNTPLSSLADQLSAHYSTLTGDLQVAEGQLRQFTAVNGAAVKAQSELYRNAAGTPLQHQYQQLQDNASQYSLALQDVQQDQKTVNSNIGQAAAIFGSTANAWAALNGAGVTSAQLLDKNKQHLGELLLEAEGYNRTLQVGTTSNGQYAAAMNAMSFASGAASNRLGYVAAALQSATQAESQMLALITGGQTALDTFEQGIGTLTSNLAAASTASTTAKSTLGTISSTLGGLKSSATLAGAALGGTTQASYALNQAFYGQVQSGQALITSLQQIDAPLSTIQSVVATTAGQMLKFAGTNTEARVAVLDFINGALGNTTVSLQSMNKWVGQNSTSLQGMNTQVAQATINASQLAGVLQQNLNQMLAQAAAAALGGQGALDKFATAVEQGDTTASTLAQQGGAQVLHMFEQMYGNSIPAAKRAFVDWAENGLGYSSSAAKALWKQLVTLQGQIDQLHGKTIQVTAHGDGTYSIQAVGDAAPFPVKAAAAGMLVTGGTAGKDSVPIMAMPGEVVVPTAMVQAGAVDHLRGQIPGFAAGGVVPGYAGSVGGMGPWLQQDYQAFQTAMTTAMETAMTGAAKTAAASGGGTVSGTAAAVQALAKSMAAARGWTGVQWTDLNNVEMAEAGWNLNAQNPSSKAYGIAQFIGGPSEYAQYGGNATTMAGQVTAFLNYVAQRYVQPSAAWAHEQEYHWYDQGGWLKPGVTMAVNGTGQPEAVIPGWSMAGLMGQMQSLFGSVQGLTDTLSGAGGSGSSALSGVAYVGNYTGVVSPASGGFGITATQLGLPPASSSSSTSAAASSATGTSTSTSTSTSTAAKAASPGSTAAGKAAASVVEGLIGGWIGGNKLAQVKQAVALLNYLGVTKYDSQVNEIGFLDGLLEKYQKTGNKAGIKSAEKLLAGYGVHSWAPQTSVKGNPAQAAVIARLETMMKTAVKGNDLTSAKQVNSLLTHFGVTKYNSAISQLSGLDALLAKYKKSGNKGGVQAVDTLLRQLAASTNAAAPKASGTTPASAAVKVLESLMPGYVKANNMGTAGQANTLLHWLGVTRYNSELSHIKQLDAYLAAYRKAGNTSGEKAVEGFLAAIGVGSTAESAAVHGNAPQAAVVAKLEAMMGKDIAGNNLTAAKQVNALLPHLGVTKYTALISQIAYLDSELAKFEKGKDKKDVKATETLLRQLGVRKFAAGGTVWEPVIGVGQRSGGVYQFAENGPETITPGAGGGGDVVSEIRALRSDMRELIKTTAAVPHGVTSGIGAALGGAAQSASFSNRYPH